MTRSPLTSRELADLVTTALVQAVDGHADSAAETMIEIGTRSNAQHSEVYGACCAFAEAARQSLVKIYGDRAPDLSKGQQWVMGQLPGLGRADAADLFALRFIVAYSNDDKPTTWALWRAALGASDDEYVSSVGALLATAASLVNAGRKA
ncbi:hypothetical protein [[Kitasatospora] papulosa]|uniref:hypothetical protein n=1 Tax=[Kitasatospora] papulosa TaxID=1464011 RepID=UPI00368CB3F6